ncbi:MAG: HD domain-containing phosphohydrolase [Planctomycetota bacterium]
MNTKIKKRSLLIGLVTSGTFVCFLIGVLVYSSWLQSSIQTVIGQQVVDDNIQTTRQLSRLIREMDLASLRDEDSWNRVQDIVEEIELPNDGFVCIIDSQTGNLICHPQMRKNPELRNVPVGSCPIDVGGGNIDIASAVLADEDSVTGGVALIKGEIQMVAVAHIPEFHANILAHQRQSGIDQAIARVIWPVRTIGACVALLMAVVVALVSYSIVKRYENRMAGLNEELEDIVSKRTRSLMKTRNAVIFGLAKLAESRDTDTGQHLDRIRSYVVVLTRQLLDKFGIEDENFVEQMALASSLHDIGKVGIPDQILLKPGKFTQNERKIMERHAAMGSDCLQAIQDELGSDDFLCIAKEIALYHHEKWDGSGYPAKKQGQDIPIPARIVALADVYDALTSKRPYKDAMPHEKARSIILEGRGAHFDPMVVDLFLDSEKAFIEIARAGHQMDVSPTSIEILVEKVNSFENPGPDTAPFSRATVERRAVSTTA